MMAREHEVVDMSLSTYHGNLQAALVGQGSLKEYGDPRVRASVSPDGSSIELILGDKREDNASSLIVERQTDRWMMLVQSEYGGDAEVIVDIMDDGRVVLSSNFSQRYPDNVEFAANSLPLLPRDKWKYDVDEENADGC